LAESLSSITTRVLSVCDEMRTSCTLDVANAMMGITAESNETAIRDVNLDNDLAAFMGG